MGALSFLVTLLLWPFPAQDGPGIGSGRPAPKDIRTLQAAPVLSGDDAGSTDPGPGTRADLGAVLVGGHAMQAAGEPRPEPRAGLTASSLRRGAAPDRAPRPGDARSAVMIRPLSPPDMSTLPGRPQPPPKVVPPLAPPTMRVGAGTEADRDGTNLPAVPGAPTAPLGSGAPSDQSLGVPAEVRAGAVPTGRTGLRIIPNP